jgi:hypothetical protein
VGQGVFQRRRAGVQFCLAACVAGGCAGEFDTTRQTPERGSIGREMYTMICDRVGAQALREDVAGTSYHAVCHADASGAFADEVDTGKLLPLGPAVDESGKPVSLEQQKANREHRIARIEALARRRDDLIRAFDAAFADETIAIKDLRAADEARSCDPPQGKASGEGELREELAAMLGRLTDLYNDDTIPHLTRALSQLMEEVEASPEARAALARFDARRGYRPGDVAMGVARPLLSYPRLHELANALLALLSSDTDPLGLRAPEGTPPKKAHERTAEDRVPGAAHGAFVQLLSVVREELRTTKVSPELPPLEIGRGAFDPTFVQLSRPRGNLELAREILLAEDPAFSIGAPRFVVRRDTRGLAKVALDGGRVPAPFVDLTGPSGRPDGLADIDDLGRFVTSGSPAPLPFPAPDGDFAEERDAAGRALVGQRAAFEYIDVGSTYLASLSRDLVPLLEPDPERRHETIMDLLAGLVVAAGERNEQASSVRTYEPGGTKVYYRAYRDDASPLLDLVHAVAQVLADPSTGDTLALLERLSADHPDVLARLVGVGLRIKAIADQHPEASIPGSSTLWDEMLDVLAKIAEQPQLVEDVIRAFGDERTQGLAQAGAAYMTMRDELTYDRDDLNGPPFNLTVGKRAPLMTPVDRSRPDTGTNRSAFQRFLQTLHDTNGMSVCTKQGAVAHIVWNGLPLDFPSFASQAACVALFAPPPKNPSPMCGLFRVENIAEELVNAVLGEVNLDIRDACLARLVSSPLTGIVGGADAFLENVSGIEGFNTKPSVQGISRMVYFDLPYPGHTGDTKNTKTRNFLRDLFDPAPTLVCPALPFTDTDGVKLNLRQCGRFEDSLRGRDQNALFPLETMAFIDSAKPLARAFKNSQANLLFVDLFDVLHRHWGSKAQSKEECDPSLPASHARWCSQDGAMSYEPLIAEALATDLFPALRDSVRVLETLKLPHCNARDPKTKECTDSTVIDGVTALAEAVKALVDPERNRGLKTRRGEAFAVRNDGTKNAQVTPIYLLIDALNGFDRRFADHANKSPGDDRLPQWRRARSQLTDQLFSVEGKGTSTRFRNPAVTKILPIVIGALRSQVAANCPDPTSGCVWGRSELPKKMRDVVTGPTFAAVLDVADAIRQDEAARTELERLLIFLLRDAQAEASRSTLTALVDVLQVFEDDENLTALLRAASAAAAPEIASEDGKVEERGLLLAAIEVLSRIVGEARGPQGERLCAREIDPNGTLAIVLRRLVTPPADGAQPAPIEVLIDVVADVNRRHPAETTKLEADDYASIAHEVADFCAHEERGLEQVYEVIRQATKDL